MDIKEKETETKEVNEIDDMPVDELLTLLKLKREKRNEGLKAKLKIIFIES